MRTQAMRKATRRFLWDRMKVSLWFVPTIMALAAFLLSWLLGWLDARVPNIVLDGTRFFMSGSISEIRSAMLGVVGTILSTTGIVFSLITLPLSSMASQFGSRLLRVFLRDRTTQLMLGVSVATFCYCLATGLSMPYTGTIADVPQISVAVGFFLTMATFASLIILIQHISTMLQAPNVVAAAGSELMEAIQTRVIYLTNLTRTVGEESVVDSLVEKEAYRLYSDNQGYIQFIDPEIILSLTRENDLFFRLLYRPGRFVSHHETVALVWPSKKIDARLEKHLKRTFMIGNQRSPSQDIQYAVDQLVEIAIRAMARKEDPFTANTCLDYLKDGLASYAGTWDGTNTLHDDDGRPRVRFELVKPAELFDAAFDPLRHLCCDNASILLHMLDVIDSIGQEVKSRDVRQDLLRHVHLVQAESRAGSLLEADKQRICLRCEMVEARLIAGGI